MMNYCRVCNGFGDRAVAWWTPWVRRQCKPCRGTGLALPAARPEGSPTPPPGPPHLHYRGGPPIPNGFDMTSKATYTIEFEDTNGDVYVASGIAFKKEPKEG